MLHVQYVNLVEYCLKWVTEIQITLLFGQLVFLTSFPYERARFVNNEKFNHCAIFWVG